MITFKEITIRRNSTVKVFRNGTLVGAILKVKGGWQFYPDGKIDGGEVFPELDDCKESLRIDERSDFV